MVLLEHFPTCGPSWDDPNLHRFSVGYEGYEVTPEILTQAPRRSELLNVEVEALERSLLELSVALRTKKMGENRWSLRCLWCFF